MPGGPTRRMPRGMRAPSRVNFFGSFRNSTTSATSSLASSTPATSLNVTLPAPLFSSCSRARDLPKENRPPAPPPIILR